MKRKDPTKTSPVKTKKGRASIDEISSPAPAALSVEEQKRRAKEWFENEERKKLEASASKSNRSTTPTTKTPAKKVKREVEDVPAPRSTRKSAREVETPSKNRTLSAKVEVEFIESDDDEEEEEEEVVAPAPKAHRTSSAKVSKEEPVLAVKAPRSARKAAPAKVATPKLTADDEDEDEEDSPVVVSRKTALEIEREKAQAWYAKELQKKAELEAKAAKEEAAIKNVPKSATKAPKSATKAVKSTTTTPNKAVTPVSRPIGHPVASASSSSSAACPFAFPTE